MQTVIRSITPEQTGRIVAEAADALRKGRIVALPTETVYGLGANRDDEGAMQKLVGLKSRPPDKPFTLHLPDPADFDQHTAMPNRFARKLIDRYWPGPLTLVARTGEDRYEGMRVPGLELTRMILREAKVPIVLPSANPAGAAPACTAQEVVDYFDGRIELVVNDGKSKIGDPSTVVRLEDDAYSVLRAGIISTEDIVQTVCRKILFVCTGNTCRSPMAEALLKSLLAARHACDVTELPYRGFLIQSAGLSALEGEPVSLNALRALQHWRVDLEGHRSQLVTGRLARQSDRIYVMTLSHRAALREKLGADLEQVDLLDRSGRDIDDPFGGPEAVYTRCASQIYTNLMELMKSL